MSGAEPRDTRGLTGQRVSTHSARDRFRNLGKGAPRDFLTVFPAGKMSKNTFEGLRPSGQRVRKCFRMPIPQCFFFAKSFSGLDPMGIDLKKCWRTFFPQRLARGKCSRAFVPVVAKSAKSFPTFFPREETSKSKTAVKKPLPSREKWGGP